MRTRRRRFDSTAPPSSPSGPFPLGSGLPARRQPAFPDFHHSSPPSCLPRHYFLTFRHSYCHRGQERRRGTNNRDGRRGLTGSRRNRPFGSAVAMADSSHRGQQRASAQAPFDAADLTKQFEQMMRIRRFNDLQQRSRSHSPSPMHMQSLRSSSSKPPSSSRRQLPIMPHPPQDHASAKFCNMLFGLSVTPTTYENPGLLDEALTVIPLDELYSTAKEEHELHLAAAASMGKKPEWGYQDFVIQALLK